VVAEAVVLLGIEHLEQGAAGSPRKSLPSLSISSSTTTGFMVPARLRALMMRPGNGPDIGAPVAADLGLIAHATQADAHELAAQGPAIDLPSEVLPTPGGPTRQRMGPFMSLLELAHGQVLDDALLDLGQAVVVAGRAGRAAAWMSRLSWVVATRAARAASRCRCG
jgi:hypothetical protein